MNSLIKGYWREVGEAMPKFLTLKEAARVLKISPSTVYNNGPAQYGGVKIMGTWRFPVDKIGVPPEPKKGKTPSGYIPRF